MARFQQDLVKRLHLNHVLINIFNEICFIAFRPKELLKIQGPHFIIAFIPYAVAFNLSIVDSKHRAAANHVKSSVYVKKLERRCDVREFLQLIEKNQCFARNKAFSRIHSRYVLNDVVCFVAIFGNQLVFGFFNKIDVYDARIIGFGKVMNRFRFSNLSGAVNDQWLSFRISLPLPECFIYFPLQIRHRNRSPLLSFFNYTPSFRFAQRNLRKMSEYFSKFSIL